VEEILGIAHPYVQNCNAWLFVTAADGKLNIPME